MADQVMVQVRFKEVREGLEYHDALYFTQAEWPLVKQATIDAEKKRRADNWYYVVTHPSPTVEPTKAELEEMLTSARAQVAELEAKLAVSAEEGVKEKP